MPTSARGRLLPWAALYVSLAFVFVRDAFLADGDRLIGNYMGDDLVGTWWVYWWTGFSVTHGEPLLEAGWMYFPFGWYPLVQFNLLDAILAAPLLLGLGPWTGYNVACALFLALNAGSLHAVARSEGCSPFAAAVGGLALLTAGPLALELGAGRTSQAFVAPMVLALGAWRQAFLRPDDRRLALVAGALSAATFLLYWYYGVFLAFGVLALLLARDGAAWGPRWRPALTGAALTLALIAVPVVILAAQADTLPGMMGSSDFRVVSPLGRGDAGLNRALEASYAPSWPVWPRTRAELGLLSPGLPWSWLVLSLGLLVAWSENRRGWLGVAVAGWLLALGPYLRLSDADWAAVPLPFLFLHDTAPFLDRLWWPCRAANLAVIGLAVLAARNADDFATELAGQSAPLRRRALLAGFAGVLLVEQALAPRGFGVLSTETLPLTSAYAQVDGPFVPAPTSGHAALPSFHLMNQVQHHQPTLYGMGGHIEGHRPAAIDRLLSENTLLKAVDDATSDSPAISAAHVAELSALGFVYVVLDRRAYPPRSLQSDYAAQRLGEALGAPVADDGTTTVWRLPPP